MFDFRRMLVSVPLALLVVGCTTTSKLGSEDMAAEEILVRLIASDIADAKVEVVTSSGRAKGWVLSAGGDDGTLLLLTPPTIFEASDTLAIPLSEVRSLSMQSPSGSKTWAVIGMIVLSLGVAYAIALGSALSATGGLR